MRKRMRSLDEKKHLKHQKTVAKTAAVKRQKEKKVMNEDTKVPAESTREEVPGLKPIDHGEQTITREKETITPADTGEMPAGDDGADVKKGNE